MSVSGAITAAEVDMFGKRSVATLFGTGVTIWAIWPNAQSAMDEESQKPATSAQKRRAENEAKEN